MRYIPAISIGFPILLAFVVLFIKRNSQLKAVVLSALVINLFFACGFIILPDSTHEIYSFTERLSFYLAVDDASRLFCGLSAVMLLLVGIFAREYMHSGSEKRFYFFYLIALGAVNGVGLAGNLMTLYLFIEFLPLCTMPLVIHYMTKDAVGGAFKYLFYSIGGAALGFVGVIFAHTFGTTLTFTDGGVLDFSLVTGRERDILIASICTIVGFSAKAGMIPLHSWLPDAHPVAPSPGIAILAGVITKAGTFAVFRFAYQIIGADFLRGTWVQHVWMILAMITIVYGSAMAYKTQLFKRRLAYSSVSQVSYILLGLALLTAEGVRGSAIHMVVYSVTKNALFLIAGVIINKVGKTHISELRGIGREMPVLMCAFVLVAFAIIGIPPTLGFMSKWALIEAALASGQGILSQLAPVALIISALLSAAYLLPIAIRAFFPGDGFEKVKRNEATPATLIWVSLLSLLCFFGGMQRVNLNFEGFGGLYTIISVLLWVVTSLFAREYFRGGKGQKRYAFFCLLTFIGTVGVFGSADLMTLFIFFEIMSFASYPLVIHNETEKAMRNGQTYLAISVAGGMSILLGLALLQNRIGTLELRAMFEITSALPDKSGLYLPAALLMFGFAGKAGLFPLHFWLPKAHPSAPAPASALLSGVLIKTGVFGAMLIAVFLLPGDATWGVIVLALAAIAMLLGALLGVFSVDMKRTFAWSSLSQIGFMFTGVALVSLLGEHNAIAIRGTLLHMVNHSLFKLVLFLLAGIVYKNVHRLHYNDIKGFGRGKPLFAIAFVSAALGLCGVPFFSGYVSKTLLHEGIVEAVVLFSQTGIAVTRFLQAVEYIFLFAGGLTVAYMLKLFVVLFIQKPDQEIKKYASPLSIVPIALVALIIPVLGIFTRLTESLAAVMEVTFLGHPPGHLIHYFEWINLKGAVTSIVIGIIVFLIFYRFTGRFDRWRYPFPLLLDFEDAILRPAVRLFCRIFLREKEQKPLTRFYTKFYQLIADDPDAVELPPERFTGSLSNTLVFFAMGVTAVLVYVFLF